MLQKNPTSSGQDELFRSRLDSILDLRHALVKLSRLIDRDGLAADL